MLVMKRKHDSNIEFLGQEKGRTVAESRALLEYEEHSAQMVAVLEVNPQELFNDEKMVVVFKVERYCKCYNIQRVFKYQEGASIAKCVVCGLSFSQTKVINEEQTAE